MKVCTNAPEHPPRELVSPDGLWAVGIMIIMLAGIFAGALGPAGVAAVAAVAIAALAAVRWPGVVFARVSPAALVQGVRESVRSCRSHGGTGRRERRAGDLDRARGMEAPASRFADRMAVTDAGGRRRGSMGARPGINQCQGQFNGLP